jgi:beta-lactamase regulating signal transducer with metallopeptidase domain
MQSLWEIVASNAVVVVVLAAGVAMLGRLWRNPLCLHLLWLLVLLKLATPPILTVPLPAMPRPEATPSVEIAATEHLAGPATGEAIEREAFAATVDRDEPSSAMDGPVLDGQASEAPVASPVVEEAREIPWVAILSWTWGTGGVLFGFACVWRTWRFGRLLRTSQPASPQVLGMAAVLARRLGLRRLPEIRMLPVCVSPLVWSFGRRARVYLPAALFERLDAAAREAIITHELAHVRRKDHWVRLLEMVVMTLFWWHPVVWWAVRRLRELEDQCCDAMVVDLSPQGVKNYATALLDTLDFLCERSMAAPLGATAAASSESMKRRIAMLKNRSWAVRLGVGHVVLLLGISALPMALAFGQQLPQATSDAESPALAASADNDAAKSGTPLDSSKRIINQRVRDFAEKSEFSSPENVVAAMFRAFGKKDVKRALDFCWEQWEPEVSRDLEDALKHDPNGPKDLERQVLDGEIVEVLSYNADLAAVVCKAKWLANEPYSAFCVGKIKGAWKCLTLYGYEISDAPSLAAAEERADFASSSVQAAETRLEQNREQIQSLFAEMRTAVEQGRTITMGDKTWRQPAKRPKNAEPAGKTPAKPAVERRAINKSVKDFPEKADLSTPESAAAAFHRVIMDPDPTLWLDLSAWKHSQRDVDEAKRKWETNQPGVAIMDDAYRNALIVEVCTYRDGLADVISKLNLPGVGHNLYSSRIMVRIDGSWKNFGEDRLPTVEAARKRFDEIKDNLWSSYVKVLDGIKTGKPVTLTGDRPKRSASIAPDQPMGISVEKADLMGRVEWTFMHGARDVTARKSLEWGDIEKDKDGNRTLRYKFEATIWGKEVMIANQVFTFDAKGNILDVTDVEGYPKKKVEKPKDVNTQKGMKDLVEDFFSKNFRDVTSRRTLEWGEVEKTKDGNSSIRHKYRARIWYKETKIMNQVFTFNPKGEFVSVKDVEGFPQPQADEPVKAEFVNSQEGMKKLVEDFFDHNFRDVKSRETIEWSDVTRTGDGNSSIRYKYRARIWDKETTIINQVFTFDRNGTFVSVKDVKEAPKKERKGGDGAAAGKTDGPAAAVARFLEAARTGNEETASRMLSTVAREKMVKASRSITPPASKTAKFAVGKVDLVGNDGARVATTWTDLGADRKEETHNSVWVLRRESDGWRIAGVASQVFADAPPVVLNFEDPEEMLRKQQWVREEFRRREPASAR